MLRRSSVPLALLALLAALALSACGNEDDDDSGGNGGGQSSGSSYGGGGGGNSGAGSGKATTLKLSADPSGALKFDKTSLKAKPGKVTVVMDNPSSLPHAIEVEGAGVEKEGKTVGKGGVSKVTADLKKGKYEFYCPVDAHKQGGMKGTLTVG
jgi:plastocyanin